jgi:two-component system sensor histidine kinase ChvG
MASIADLPKLARLPLPPPIGRGRLVARLLAFNLLLVFVPIAGLLLLGPYERQLLESQERAMVRQGRLAAAALASGGELDAARAERLLAELGRRSESRLRIVDRDGRVLADSSLLGPRQRRAAEPGAASTARASDRRGWLYALGAWPFELARRLGGEAALETAAAEEYYGTAERLLGAEVRSALAGRYGATTRISPGPERAVILYSALPVELRGEVVGAVLVSQSTARLLAQLDEVRLAIFRVFLISVAVAIALSAWFARSLARPLRALALEARALVDGRGRLRGRFRGSRRHDEIGELARALEELTRRLESRQAATEAFAADVSHELRNPLASIRAATEMLAAAESAADRRRFLAVVEQEVARAERLLGSVREIVGLETPGAEEARRDVDLGVLAGQLVDSFRLRAERGVRFSVRLEDGPLVARGTPERFAAVIENLLDNAAGFSPAGGEVELEVARADGSLRLAVSDRGPGIPEEHLGRVFDRFFSWRPAEANGAHSGLGLAIVRAVAEAHGGRVRAANREGGGATVTVELPAG